MNHSDLIAIRRDVHTHPELQFDKSRTGEIVAEKFGVLAL